MLSTTVNVRPVDLPGDVSIDFEAVKPHDWPFRPLILFRFDISEFGEFVVIPTHLFDIAIDEPGNVAHTTRLVVCDGTQQLQTRRAQHS